MSTTSNLATNLQGTSAGLQALAAGLFGLLSAGGWVQTADTGQTANASFTGPGIINTSAGYQIWRMSDALQVAGSNIFVKFELGTNSQASFQGSSIWITVGTGSDGAGNITGILLNHIQIDSQTGVYSTTTSGYYGSASTNRVAWYQFSGVVHLGFSIERTHDASGNDTNEGFLAIGFGGSSAALTSGTLNPNKYYRFTNNTLPASTILGAWAPSGATWADAATNNIGVCPVRLFNGAPSNPSLAWMVYLQGDQSADQVIPIHIYTVTHNYITLGSGRVSTTASGNANATFAMLYE